MKYTIESTSQYDKWFKKLKDASSRIKILARLSGVENGNFGDFKQLGENLYELRLFLVRVFEFIIPLKKGKLFFCLSEETSPTSKKISTKPMCF